MERVIQQWMCAGDAPSSRVLFERASSKSLFAISNETMEPRAEDKLALINS